MAIVWPCSLSVDPYEAAGREVTVPAGASPREITDTVKVTETPGAAVAVDEVSEVEVGLGLGGGGGFDPAKDCSTWGAAA